MKQTAKLVHEVKLPNAKGTFVAPVAFEIPSIKVLQREVFGPVLHIIRFKAKDLHKVVEEINSTGYGLTFGMHSRINETIQYLQDNVHAGNVYVNRNIIGAIVGVQPFGGEGLSGTGPKAGGPFYLPRLACERVVSVNTTAAGGNASLMSLQEDAPKAS
jgi:RHH-type proline utilization regulon transcriptional repressor/proline dehydrogenase/delta 1-pyrroline-5-carboxylate dehydrogenase